jgi:tRNA(fMet)-specific endonuclease VapC
LTYYLDADTCIYYLNGKYVSIIDNFRKHKPGDVKIPAIVKAELLYGYEKSLKIKEYKNKLDSFLFNFEIISFDDNATNYYSIIRAKLEKKSKLIGPNDIIIAATVLANKGILITNNVKKFKNVEGLKIINWVKLIVN